MVSSAGVSADPDKVLTVKKFAATADANHIWSFLGLTLCYFRFIPAFFKVAAFLFVLTDKGT